MGAIQDRFVATRRGTANLRPEIARQTRLESTPNILNSLRVNFAVNIPLETVFSRAPELSFGQKFSFRSLFVIDKLCFDRICCSAKDASGHRITRNAMGAATHYASPDQEDFSEDKPCTKLLAAPRCVL